ncbi:GGDEF domain-containing protein [Acinetobacter defluvii]|uniref:GGDEF domain-containing protein n=1 Tax=Acinetobacter defluvii TaxID=1871111 RepID=UPI003AF6C987
MAYEDYASLPTYHYIPLIFYKRFKIIFMTNLSKTILNYIQSTIIMRWTNIQKCILVLVLAILMHLLWIVWKLYIIITPDIWQWVNLPLIKKQLQVNIISIICLIILICISIFNFKKDWVNYYFSYFIITTFILILILDGYFVGIYSPATIFTSVCVTGIGLVLFSKKIIYFNLIIATSIFSVLIYLTTQNTISYAPIFSSKLLSNTLYHNYFWVYSMIYFIIPVLFAGLLFFELLLYQWRYRESLFEKISQIDPLTELYNRRFFNEKINELKEQQTSYIIIILDLDHFKTINDSYGHHTGDAALIQIAKTLSRTVRKTDIVARYGGEEFILLLSHITIHQALEIAEKCRKTIADEPLKLNNEQSIHITASFGVGMSTTDSNLDKALRFADQALYHAKQSGRNQVQLFDGTTFQKFHPKTIY